MTTKYGLKAFRPTTECRLLVQFADPFSPLTLGDLSLKERLKVRIVGTEKFYLFLAGQG